jgi:hypothetical protein
MTSGIIPEEFSELTSLVGYAVWQIQVLEQVLASYLVMVHQITTDTARTEVETMFLKTAKHTLGQLFSAIRKTGGGPESLLPRLERFIVERNWLVHRSRHENRSDLYSPAKRTALRQRLCSIADEALLLMKAFQQATEDHLIGQGMTKAEIDARAKQIRKEWTESA